MNTYLCGECDNAYEETFLAYAQLLDYQICHNCSSTKCRDCDFCGETVYYENFTLRIPLTDEEIVKVKEIFAKYDCEYICMACIHSVYRRCDDCPSVDFIDLNLSDDEIYLRDEWYQDERWNRIRNRILEPRKAYLLQKYNIYGSCHYCNDCYESVVESTAIKPTRSLRIEDFKPSKNDRNNIKRHVGIETEMLYDELRDMDVSELDSYDIEHYIDTPNYWDGVYDGSLSNGGVELRTRRPVVGDDISVAIDSLRSNINSYMPEVDDSCGVHIHFNALDFGYVELKNLLYVMKGIEHVIYKSLPNNRIANRYCKSIDSLNYSDLEKVDNMSSLHKLYYNKIADTIPDSHHYNGARYQGLNLHARFFLGTIEFRYHEGTTNVDNIMSWINLCNWIVDASKMMSMEKKLSREQRKWRDKLRDTFIYSKCIKTTPIERIALIGGRDSADYISERISKNSKIQ
jgi:hypothetical protein